MHKKLLNIEDFYYFVSIISKCKLVYQQNKNTTRNHLRRYKMLKPGSMYVSQALYEYKCYVMRVHFVLIKSNSWFYINHE